MKRIIKISNKTQNINKIEEFVDIISSEYELFSSYHSNIMTVSDIIFNCICDTSEDYNVTISLEKDTDSLHLIWLFDKSLFESFQKTLSDNASDIFDVIGKLCDNIFIDNENYELHLYFATGSVNHHLSIDRRKHLQQYFSIKVKQNQLNDTLSDN